MPLARPASQTRCSTTGRRARSDPATRRRLRGRHRRLAGGPPRVHLGRRRHHARGRSRRAAPREVIAPAGRRALRRTIERVPNGGRHLAGRLVLTASCGAAAALVRRRRQESAALRALVTVTAACAPGSRSPRPGRARRRRRVTSPSASATTPRLAHGPGTLESRLNELSKLGAEVVRFTIRWDRVAARRPQDARDPTDSAYQWAEVDGVLRGLRRHGIDPVVTLFGTPGWANGGRSPNWAPTSSRLFAAFAYAAGRRYPWIKYWTIWNEPNRPTFLRPTTAKTYVETLLNPRTRSCTRRSATSRSAAGLRAAGG